MGWMKLHNAVHDEVTFSILVGVTPTHSEWHLVNVHFFLCAIASGAEDEGLHEKSEKAKNTAQNVLFVIKM